MRPRPLIKLSLLTLCAVAIGGAAPPYGTWRMNTEKSRVDPGPSPYKSFSLTLAPAEGGSYRVTAKGELQDGTPFGSTYLMKSDGKDYPVTNAPFDSISAVEEKPNVSVITMKRQGKVVEKTRSVVSGNVMTNTTEGVDPAGRSFHAVGIMEKQ